jgi:FAD binding domain
VLLAGDAAHEMPPFLAQGMCSGIRDSHNLAWKLDLVLAGRHDRLLDTYQPEREPHVRFITEKAIELGRVQTLRDPAKALERDERLLAQRRANKVPDKVRFPALKGGLIADNGTLFPQARVRSKGQIGLFDDVAGSGWCIVAFDPKLLDALPVAHRDEWQSIGGWYAAFGPAVGAGELEDVDGAYASWFATHACAAAIVRPDWHIYGTARSANDLVGLLDQLARTMPRNEH